VFEVNVFVKTNIAELSITKSIRLWNIDEYHATSIWAGIFLYALCYFN